MGVLFCVSLREIEMGRDIPGESINKMKCEKQQSFCLFSNLFLIVFVFNSMFGIRGALTIIN